jgi:hypothetical protein
MSQYRDLDFRIATTPASALSGERGVAVFPFPGK